MSIKTFLRYNTRHHVFFGGNGRWPRLNPTTHWSHTKSGKRTASFHEPLWVFKIRVRLFAHAGRQRCGRRDETWMGVSELKLPDTWDIGPDGNRTCSYCGSIHFDDLIKIARLSLVDDKYAVEGTTKSYKLYVKQPGVVNAGQGAIKFYAVHHPGHASEEDNAVLRQAIKLTDQRMRARWPK